MASQPHVNGYIHAGSYDLKARFLLFYDPDGEKRMQILTASPNLPKMGLSDCLISSITWNDAGTGAIASGSFVAKGVTYQMQMEYDSTGRGKAQCTLIAPGKPPVTSVWIGADVNEFEAPSANPTGD